MKLRVSKQRISTHALSMTDVSSFYYVLLIGSNFVSQTGLPIRLPGSSTSVRQSYETLLITYYNDGHLYFMDRPITIQQLKDILQQKYQTPEQVVRIAVEKQVSVQKLIDLMDIVREIGYEHIFIATTVEKG